MRYTCSTCVRASIVNLFKDSVLINQDIAYFNVAEYPKIMLKQRICIDEFHRTVKIVLNIFNFECKCYENICLINTITPDNLEINVINSDGEVCQQKNITTVKFSKIPSLSVQTVELEVKVCCGDELTSVACLHEEVLGKQCDDTIRKSICKLTI